MARWPQKDLEINGARSVGEVELPSSGDVSRDQLVQEVEPVTDMSLANDKAANLKFMEEIVTIRLSETNNPNDPRKVFVGVGEKGVWLDRGVELDVKRKYVANLATALPISYQSYEAVNNNGERTVRMRAQQGVRFPFTVLKDSPQGFAWLREIQNGR